MALTASGHAMAQAQGDALFSVSSDGQSVVDLSSGLSWARCVEGMKWNGQVCEGTAKRAPLSEAKLAAQTRSRLEQKSWRIPSVNELRQLASHLRRSEGQVDMLFPQAPTGWYWTSSITIDTQAANQYSYRNIERGLTEQNINRLSYLHAWVVEMESGRSRGDVPRREHLPVRLVYSASANHKPSSP